MGARLVLRHDNSDMILNVQDKEPWLKCYIRSIIDQVMGVEKFCEVIVLSLFLLFLLPDMSMHFLMPNDGTRMWTVGKGLVDPSGMCSVVCHTVQVTADNLEEAFKGNNEHYQKAAALSIDKISVYKSPLSAPFSSSKDSVRNVMQGQYLSVDYHAYMWFLIQVMECGGHLIKWLKVFSLAGESTFIRLTYASMDISVPYKLQPILTGTHLSVMSQIIQSVM